MMARFIEFLEGTVFRLKSRQDLIGRFQNESFCELETINHTKLKRIRSISCWRPYVLWINGGYKVLRCTVRN